MEMTKEFAVLLGRILSILPLMLIVTLFMGKRSIAELPVFDFLVMLLLGSVVGADIADPEISHIHTAVAIILIGVFHIILSTLKIKHRKFGHIITFEPTIVIGDGKFIVKNLRKIRYSIDNILQMLRENDVFDISEVHLAIVEANGKLSVLKKAEKNGVTLEDLDLIKSKTALAYPVIMDGIVIKTALNGLKITEEWLSEQLENINIKSAEEVFFASVDDEKHLHVSLKSYMEHEDGLLPNYR